MAPISRFLALLIPALASVFVGWQPAQAATPAVVHPQMINTAYEEPADARLRPYYEELKRRRALERLQLFMAALKLPRPLTVRTAQCGAETVPYKSGGPVTICYELVKHIAAVAASKSDGPVERAQILYGTFIQAMLHQMAYAVFDELHVPIWGRKADAADRLAAFIMMQFGSKIALTTVLGTARFFEYSGHRWTGKDFASPDSPESQRFYNYLCIAFGGDPATFDVVGPWPNPGSGIEPLAYSRAVRCAGEYQQVRKAFDLRIMPFVDPDLLVKVRASQWMLADEIPQ